MNPKDYHCPVCGAVAAPQIDSGAIYPAYFYEVTFRRLKKAPPKLEKEKIR